MQVKKKEVIVNMETKIRLITLGVKQVDLIQPLAKKGVHTSQCELNLAINGRGTQEKHKRILEAVDEILTEMEEKK